MSHFFLDTNRILYAYNSVYWQNFLLLVQLKLLYTTLNIKSKYKNKISEII